MKPTGNPAMATYERGRPDNDGFLRKTFTLPVDDARAKVREIMRERPTGGFMTIVEGGKCPTDKFNSRCGDCRRRISLLGPRE